MVTVPLGALRHVDPHRHGGRGRCGAVRRGALAGGVRVRPSPVGRPGCAGPRWLAPARHQPAAARHRWLPAFGAIRGAIGVGFLGLRLSESALGAAAGARRAVPGFRRPLGHSPGRPPQLAGHRPAAGPSSPADPVHSLRAAARRAAGAGLRAGGRGHPADSGPAGRLKIFLDIAEAGTFELGRRLVGQTCIRPARGRAGIDEKCTNSRQDFELCRLRRNRRSPPGRSFALAKSVRGEGLASKYSVTGVQRRSPGAAGQDQATPPLAIWRLAAETRRWPPLTRRDRSPPAASTRSASDGQSCLRGGRAADGIDVRRRVVLAVFALNARESFDHGIQIDPSKSIGVGQFLPTPRHGTGVRGGKPAKRLIEVPERSGMVHDPQTLDHSLPFHDDLIAIVEEDDQVSSGIPFTLPSPRPTMILDAAA